MYVCSVGARRHAGTHSHTQTHTILSVLYCTVLYCTILYDTIRYYTHTHTRALADMPVEF